MRLTDFEALVRRQTAEIPAEFLEGVVEVVVSPRTLPHPERGDVWTLGECIPLPGADADPRHQQSRVVLYHGSFQALARDTESFDWATEAWETLTHEIRHHVEWKAHAPDLEAYDDAAEANFARQDDQPFDPDFYRDGLRLSDGSFQVEADVFIERVVTRLPEAARLHWRGQVYEVTLPAGAAPPVYLTILGLDEPPEGDLIMVFRRRAGWLGLFRRAPLFQAEVEARALAG